jgi:hypothetical protein
MPFEKRFLKKLFSHQISSKPLGRQEMEHKKRDKRKRRKRKKKKAPRVSSNKRGSQYFERRKTPQLQRSFFI